MWSGQVFGRDVNTVRGFVEALRKASRDSRVRAVLLMPSTLELPYWGKVQEMRDAIVAFRKSGKSVTAFLEYGGDREYYLASAADRVFLMPTSSLDLTGVASYEMFLRGTFDKLGAYPDFVHIGDYKTAPESVHAEGIHARAPRDGAVAEPRHVRAARGRHCRGPEEERGRDPRAAGSGAVRGGEGARGRAGRRARLRGRARRSRAGTCRRATRRAGSKAATISASDPSRSASGRDRASRSSTSSGRSSPARAASTPVNGSVAGSETIVEQIRKIRDDDSIKAIVLRIDSPGDRRWRPTSSGAS